MSENQQITSLPLLDEDVLAKVASDTSWGFLSTTINQFFDETEARLPRMLENTQSKNWTDLASEAHALKGSSAWFGAMQLNAVSKQIEQAAKSSDEAAATQAVTGLKVVVENSITTIKTYLQSKAD